MFTIEKNPEFTHPVTVMTPVDGGHREDTFRARFLVVSTVEMDELLAEADDGAAFLRRVLTGAEDVIDEAGRPIPWSDALRDTLIGLRHVRLGLVAAYVRAIGQVKRGN